MQEAMRIGLVVAAILAVLTFVEYVFAVNVSNDVLRFIGLALAAFGKAGAIIYYFMHVNRIWRVEESH